MVVATTLIILFLMTGSVVLPIKAVIMNALGLCAMFGILVLIFQDGNLQGLLSYRSLGALDATQPILLFAVGFGLATDYGVFLLSRIKEARDAGASDAEAVAIGLERTGRIVTAAALLFAVALGAFSTSEIVFVKELGRRRGAGGPDRRLDHPRAAGSVADDAARPAQLVGADTAPPAVRARGFRKAAASRRPSPSRSSARAVPECFTGPDDGPGTRPGALVRSCSTSAACCSTGTRATCTGSCSTATRPRWSASSPRCARWSGTTPTTSACRRSARARRSWTPTRSTTS